ncbi:hypothetical protein L6452_03267 [Arctium lappa]|uniref:Uncharacterized protein n=1 Tax=Arctium lappa TaxID=4217 RepID=A0ACB9FNC4_ARCLA|nr:hypothetical protein L6452_03267 [Arctium lappa]
MLFYTNGYKIKRIREIEHYRFDLLRIRYHKFAAGSSFESTRACVQARTSWYHEGATVSVVFDNSDRSRSPLGYEDCLEITVRCASDIPFEIFLHQPGASTIAETFAHTTRFHNP